MTEALAFGLIVTASGLLFGADRARGVARWPWLDARPRALAARGAALLGIAAATLLWNRHEPGPAAFLAVPVALMATSTLIALLAPLGPRLVGALALAAAPLGLLVFLGGKLG